MRSAEDDATRHAADKYQLLLDRYAAGPIYIRDKATADKINAGLPEPAFKHGTNYTVAGKQDSLYRVLSNESEENATARAALLGEMKVSLRLTREGIKDELSGRYTPAHSREADAATLLDSAMLSGRPEARAEGSAYTRLQTLSANNLKAIDDELARYKDLPQMKTKECADTVNTFMGDVFNRYQGGIATHASNNPVRDNISCTSDRNALEQFAIGVTGDKSAGPKLSHTSATNTQHLQTHDLVFFNVYPKTNAAMQEEQQRSTRYLREKPEIQGSPYSRDAQSFSFPMSALAADGERLRVMTLRDPVYPSGGTTEADAKKRMEQGGIATVGGGAPAPGVAERRIGTVVDRYETHKNLFVGPDIEKALSKNVELGIYKTLHGLQEAARDNPSDERCKDFFVKLKTANEAVGADKDKQVMDVIKLYQYPQLMVAGSVPVKGAEVYRPSRELIEQSQRGAPVLAGGAGSPAQATVHDAEGRKTVQAAFDKMSGKEQIAKNPGNVATLVNYVDHLAGEHGAVKTAKLENKNLFKVTFADNHVLSVKPVDMNGIKLKVAGLQQAESTPQLAESSQAPSLGQAASGSGGASIGKPGGDEHKVMRH